MNVRTTCALAAATIAACIFSSCEKQSSSAATNSNIKVESYGKLADGREAKIFTLKNKNGLIAKVTEFGAVLVSLEVPDKNGKFADVTLGYDTLAGWESNKQYFGSSVGRFGNRIKDGKFSLNGKEYQLAKNNSPGNIPCHLHGGVVGFNKVLWTGKEVAPNSVEFTYLSKDGEEGYPGNLTVKVTYTLNDNNELIWKADATTDQDTIINIVHHTYWNLTGNPSNTILDHSLLLNADHFLATDAGLIPTGEKTPVVGTPMDFTTPHVIGERVNVEYEPMKLGLGYDHCWVLRPATGVQLAARLVEPTSGRVMEVSTDQPAIQFYCGNFLDGSDKGKGGTIYNYRTGLCLETEGFPDAPNQASFPTAVLKSGEKYSHTMVLKFLTQ